MGSDKLRDQDSVDVKQKLEGVLCAGQSKKSVCFFLLLLLFPFTLFTVWWAAGQKQKPAALFLRRKKMVSQVALTGRPNVREI